jgi:adenine-specific DNA methylase
MPYPKRLIEVDLPIKRISAHARREKSIRHGHISTLHIWWARRPLAACRAVICAALWPDPADENCPPVFVKQARKLMLQWTTHERQNLLSTESRARFEAARQQPKKFDDATELRTALLDFIADFANWDNSTVREYLDTSRALTQAAHEALGGAPGTRPLVVDPFAGGGSIPLEALRVGADAFASDLNPVPVLLNKVVLEYIPKYACLPAGRASAPPPEPVKFYVYVLRCKDDSLYKGQTDNVPRRLKQHEAGEVEWTAPRLPVELVHVETFDSRDEAVERGKYLKSGSGREWLAEKLKPRSLADEVRKWGEWIKREAEKELAEFYPCLPAGRPRTPDEATPGKFYAYVLRCSDGSLYKGQTDNLVRRFKQHCNGEVEWTKAHLPVDLIHFEEFDTREESVEREKYLKSGVGREWLASKFPKETPIAYLWARTIQCEGPGCGAEVPLIRALWLAKKANRSIALKIVPNPKAKRVDFQIIVKTKKRGWINQDKAQDPNAQTLEPTFEGTVKRGSATCPCCGYTTPVARVRAQLKLRRGGADDARLMCVVTTHVDEQGRFYRIATDQDLNALKKAAAAIEHKKKAHVGPLSLVPDEKLDVRGIRHTWAMIYGLERWGDYFTPRQALSLTSLIELVKKVSQESDDGLAIAVRVCLALAIGKQSDRDCSLCRWISQNENIGYTFGRQAIGMMWDFVEAPWLSSGGGWSGILEDATEMMRLQSVVTTPGHVEQSSATKHPLPEDSAQAMITDPPYYDSVPYAHLSDFFYVWLRRALCDVLPDLFRDSEVPKDQEIVVDRPHELSNSTHDIAFYERELTKAFAEGRRIVEPNGIGTIVFASKSTSSWEAILKAVIDASWVVTGSWPIDTEREARIAAQGQARLGSSIHLVCRPRLRPADSGGQACEIGLPAGASAARLPDGQEVGDWRDVLQALPIRIHEWMPRLAEEGVVGADAIFACLGPALEIFSRYSRVEKASGEPVTLKEYLEQVWAAVAKEALALVFKDADATGFEEDARLTAMWLWTLNAGNTDATNGDSTEDDDADDESEGGTKKVKATGFILEYDAARKIAQGLGAHLEGLGSLVEVSGETARLLPVGERARYLFGKDEGQVTTARKKKLPQMDLFKVLEQADDGGTTFGETKVERHGETVLDRIHQSMILFAAGRSEAMKRFLVEDGAGRDPRFWKLADCLSKLYPSGCEEKRWVDGVLARKKGLGF